jgi:hypothetical protein
VVSDFGIGECPTQVIQLPPELPPTQALLRYFSLHITPPDGDICRRPLREPSNLEVVVGQLYLVIQVAWLVGRHVSMKSK